MLGRCPERNALTITFSNDILQATHMSEAELACEFAVLLFRNGKLSLGQASRLAGMPQVRFQHVLASREIPLHYGEAEFEKDLATLDTLRRA
jgi:predicted HTH domain antitoxin